MDIKEKLDLIKEHLTKSYKLILECLADTNEIDQYKEEFINQLHESAKELRRIKKDLS